MKTKKLLFSLLLLLLGTATAWADKYYMPKSYRSATTPRLTLDEMIAGKPFMIYNAAIDNGGVDKTGFLRNGGAMFQHDKSKERDKFVYNESFVYMLETHTDDNGVLWYAIKSLSTGTYVDCNGVTTHKNATGAKLNIYNWAVAREKGYAAWTTDMECWGYDIVANSEIAHQNVVFVVGGKDTRNNNASVYWNGDVDSFITDNWLGHPYVFYEAIEFVDEASLPVRVDGEFLHDLHVYSRCDMYSAQRAYGYVHVHSAADNKHITVPGRQEMVYGTHLVDGDVLTALNLVAGESLQFLLSAGETTNAVRIHLQRNADKTNSPTAIKVQVSNDGDDWTTIEDSLEVSLTPSFTTGKIEFEGEYSYIRISNADTNAPMSLSEVYILPANGVIDDVIEYLAEIASLDNVIHTKASAQVYVETIEDYNSRFPAAKLISGVPFPGNKYRIHADVFSHNEHEKLQLSANESSANLGGDYFEAQDRKIYEWYCEELPYGSLAFKNVANGKYLALDGQLSDTPIGWEINTNLTQRTGVPLRYAGCYLAVRNDAGGFVSNVKTVLNQTIIPLSSDNGTPDDLSDDIYEQAGVCTDFVFMPVEVDENEKKITFMANELVMRNTVLKYNDAEYTMPFSHMFKAGESLPVLELQCPVIHHYDGVMVDGVMSLEVADTTTVNGKKILEFKWDKIKNGDVLDIQLEITPPFVVTPEASEENPNPKPALYLIRNKRTKGLQQQAHPNRANIGIEGDGPISVAGGRKYYAKFDTRSTNMSIVPGFDDGVKGLDATSLFFFTHTEDTGLGEYYSVNINNATTVMKFATTGVWDENGDIWYVQPDHNGAFSGYNIGATKLNATNNPNDAWSAGENVDVIYFSTPDDDGTAWEFVAVEDSVAKEMLKEFIDRVAADLTAKLLAIDADAAAAAGYDVTKIEHYKFVVNQLKERGAQFHAEGNIYKLVQYAQNIHMVEHEIEYALIGLPLLSDETKMDEAAQFANPKWYYIRNVTSDKYAAYTSYDQAMNLEQFQAGTYHQGGGMRLKNMFYFAGNKNSYAPLVDSDPENDSQYNDHPGNNLIIDEYLKIHLHNFMAGRNTLVSKNLTVLTVNNVFPGDGIKMISGIEGGLGGSENWTIEAEYSLDGSSFNAYGSCLLSSKKDALADDYYNAFQVFFKDNRTVVLKINDEYDTVTFTHTQEFYSKIKVVVTYLFGKLTIDVYNSAGQKETWEGYVQLNDISALYSAFPAERGIVVDHLVVKKTEKMNWKEHLQDAKYDLWYIFPSSNLAYKGFAITLDGPNDNNMGWTNAHGVIDTDLGNHNNSSWQFERVTDFDDHINELLDIYNLKDCVIYNKELAALMKLIIKNKALIENEVDGAGEEAWFNEVYYAITNYKGPKPEELIAPKPGRLYTIRPVVDEDTENALLVHVDAADKNYATKEVYNADVVRDDMSYDSRAAWIFESNVPANEAGFLPLTGLKAKNIHTQCYFMPLAVDCSMVNEVTDATVTLAPLGACTTMFKVGEGYMAQGNVVKYAEGSGFWGSALEEYPTAVGNVLTPLAQSDAAVHCKEIAVKVEGDVTVTFTHIDGTHKLNILGVELVGADGSVVKAEFHYGTAGNEHVNNVYELGNVEPGEYTLKCYVCEVNGDHLQSAGGKIVVDGIAGADKITNRGDAKTQWIVEEILDPEERVYYVTSTNQNGHSSLMLGFAAKIPDEVEAFYGNSHHSMIDGRYLLMVSYDEAVLPAKTPVVLRNRDYANNTTTIENIKFYYSAQAVDAYNANYLYGSLYWTLVECASFDGTDVDGDGNVEADVNIYMLQTNKTDVKMYWVYENYRADGTKTGNNDLGGYVLCKANKAYMVLPSDKAGTTSSYSFRFDEPTTDIEGVEDENSCVSTIYDLQGRKLTDICHPGVYIVGGKKIIVK